MTVDLELRAALERLGAPKVRRHILGWCQPSGQAWNPAEHHDGLGPTAPLSNTDGTGPRLRAIVYGEITELAIGVGFAEGYGFPGTYDRNRCADGIHEFVDGRGLEYEYMIRQRGWG